MNSARRGGVKKHVLIRISGLLWISEVGGVMVKFEEDLGPGCEMPTCLLLCGVQSFTLNLFLG